MDREKSNSSSLQIINSDSLSLPSLPKGVEASMQSGNSFNVDGTNVVRVPFGIRQPKKQRPQAPERMATLVLPFQPQGNPPPPPQAA